MRTSTVRSPRFVLLLVAVVGYLTLPGVVSAHVKWFAHYDEATRPMAFAEVASSTFFLLFAAFVTMVFFGFLLDGWVARRWPRLGSLGSSLVAVQEKWVRLGMGAFLLCIWDLGLNILTPELHTKMTWVFTIHFLSAFCLAWRPTCVVAAFGIVALYVVGIVQYGFFHMLDYVFFLGLAVFLAGVTVRRLVPIRQAVMTGSLAFSIMWTAIEKFVYPQWTEQILSKHSTMALGMPFSVFTLVAAFVEFTLAFYLATGRGLLRLGALALMLVFVMAMPEFGRLDVVGHLPLVAILGIPLVGGGSALQRMWPLPRGGGWRNAGAVCVLYTVALGVFFAAYYGVQALEYGRVAG